MPWNPEQYNKFKKQRFASFEDLYRLINIKPQLKILDLGCGTGELTRMLQEKIPDASIMGIDNSVEMLRESRAFVNENISFKKLSIEEVTTLNEKWDLIFSHSALQWVESHQPLITRLITRLKKGGQIVIEMSDNHKYITHELIKAIASTEPFRSELQGWIRPNPLLKMEEYAALLYENGGINIKVFEKIYPQELNDSNALISWCRGTALLPYMERLSTETKNKFLETFSHRIKSVFDRKPIFFPMKRMFLSANF